MEEKKKIKKAGRFNGLIIALLVIIIIAMVGTAVVYYLYQKKQASSEAALAKSTATETTKIKEGSLNLSVDDVTGTVSTNQSVDLYWQTSGTIANVYVNVGDKVKKGDILADLDQSTLDADVLNAQIDLQDAQDAMDKLKNNTEGISNALADMVTKQQAVKDAQDSLDSMDMSRVTDVTLDLAKEAYDKAEMDYQNAIYKYNQLSDNDKIDWGDKRLGDISGYRSVRDNALAEYQTYMGNIDQTELQSRQAALVLAEAQYADAEDTYNKLLAGPTTAELDVKQAAIDSAQNKIDSYKITAPFDGTITKVDAKTGDVVSYSSDSTKRDVFAVREEDISTFYVDFSVSEVYVNNIKVGQPVTISFAAIPGKTYNGTVSNVSNTGVTSGLSVTFDIQASITDADDQIKSGMTADVSMAIASVENALYVPQTAIIMKDGKYYVNQKMSTDGTFTNQEVQIGLISGSNVQITSDTLKKDDEIQLNVNATTESTDDMFMFGPGGGMPGGGGGGGMPSGGGMGPRG